MADTLPEIEAKLALHYLSIHSFEPFQLLPDRPCIIVILVFAGIVFFQHGIDFNA